MIQDSDSGVATTTIALDNSKGKKASRHQETEILARLQAKCSQDKFLSEKNLDDPFLLKFLRSRDYDLEVTFSVLKGYFTMRKEHPGMFRLPSEVIGIMKDKLFKILPKRNSSGELVVIARPGLWDPNKYDAQFMTGAGIPFLELVFLDEDVQLNGVVEIINCAGISWRQLLAMPHSQQKLSSEIMERSLPIKINKIHIVNENRLVDMIWAVLKPFVSEEFRNRFCFHGRDFSQLPQCIDLDLIPKELGGNLEDEEFSMDEAAISEMDNKIRGIWDRYPC